jgi:hypothetical protein
MSASKSEQAIQRANIAADFLSQLDVQLRENNRILFDFESAVERVLQSAARDVKSHVVQWDDDWKGPGLFGELFRTVEYSDHDPDECECRDSDIEKDDLPYDAGNGTLIALKSETWRYLQMPNFRLWHEQGGEDYVSVEARCEREGR